ncbi:predicted protein [Postia placenta Mad-698-R]|uniref:Uncharacterized protein n=1 Tax=Postia placenta MAD-698-R-SB12 TaxID=670580 RepID=A0A1X6MY15_9APHY|nr:hypothetical protein POSPLADRAFT_1145831 [Postia placenta MAD-698-R-SB12]EED80723.1 predicted protein [Postia placenta Mad-698-R]OSX61237.1 hypothetical protein POSPLADRAFT_1145831 [Postia placenta MAD-698-R-SB12]
MFMRFRGGGIGHMAIAEVTERLLQESHEDMQDNLEGHPTDKPSIPDALRPARGRDQEYADVRHSEVVLGNPPNTLTVGMLCQEGPNNIQAEEADYGYIDNDAEDIDDGGEIGTDDEDALGPEDGEDDGDSVTTIQRAASILEGPHANGPIFPVLGCRTTGSPSYYSPPPRGDQCIAGDAGLLYLRVARKSNSCAYETLSFQ